MNIFFMLIGLLAIDVHAGMVSQVVKTYGDLDSKKYCNNVSNKTQEITKVVKCTREALSFLPSVLHSIIESYYEKEWFAETHITDQEHWFNFLKARYSCLTYMNGKFAAGNSDGNIEMYDVGTSKLVKKILAHDAPVKAIAYEPTTQIFYSSAQDERIKIWNSKYASTSHCMRPSTYATVLLPFNSNQLIVGDDFGNIEQWSVESDKKRALQRPHEGTTVQSLAKLNDKCLISSTAFGTINVWDMSTHECIIKLDNSATYHNYVVVANEYRIATICAKNIILYDVRTHKIYKNMPPHQQHIKAIAMLGKSILTGEAGGTLRLYDIVPDGLLPTFQFPVVGKSNIMALAADPDESNFVSAAAKPVGTLTHWRYTHPYGNNDTCYITRL